ncbi:hypothetical protein FHS29_001877 [Saccharothrix tamanrassetensis]|uniref:Secreted protein n=1 Tax=Saccharothrix tamanrassetensis TaxID=1051531 RepID=A0A841CHZ6_9PSEU|nr:hypothetical protein [Saccharothrix tamanrassetensis]MBB5955296.1 hypothetical protein [Saccharothrix tamanrassetensis]
MRLRVLALAVLLTGCGTATHGDGTPGGQVRPAAPPPADFPVAASPRPIVLVGPVLAVVDGFASGDEKLGSHSGAFEFAGPHPATPEPARVTLPDGPATLPFIPVADALGAMARQAEVPAAGPPSATPPTTTPGAGTTTAPAPPVKLVAVEFGSAEFPTDRGRRALPAWRFTTEAGSVVAWPALRPDAFWKPGEVRPAIVAGPASGTGADLTVPMASAPDPCPGDAPARNEPVVAETRTAVAVSLRTIGTVGDCPRTLVLKTQPYQVKLAEPLGNRLLVDGDGGVIAVTTP